MSKDNHQGEIKPCSVRIQSVTDEKKNLQSCKGTITNVNEKTVIAYTMQYSNVKIVLGEGYMHMIREGDCYLDLTFDQSEQETVGMIGLSRDTAGEIGIITKTLQIATEGENDKIKITLNYVLRYAGRQDQPVDLQLIADAR